MAIRSDKNIEALRIGIREQERQAILAEQVETAAQVRDKREWFFHGEGIEVIPAIALLVGDKLLATDNGTTFWVTGTVRRVARTTERGNRPAGDFWLTVDDHPGHSPRPSSYGTAMRAGDKVLVAGGVERAVRAQAIREREEERYKRPSGGGVSFEGPARAAA